MLARYLVRSLNVDGGLTFSRRADGAVEIALDGRGLLSIVPANEWASLIATMTDEGEDGRSFRHALSLHTGSAYDADARAHPAETFDEEGG